MADRLDVDASIVLDHVRQGLQGHLGRGDPFRRRILLALSRLQRDLRVQVLSLPIQKLQKVNCKFLWFLQWNEEE